MNILVTGGASGIGKGIVQKLCTLPLAHIYFTYCKSHREAQSIEKEFPNSTAIKCDFTNDVELNQFLEKISTLSLNVLINNAVTSIAEKHFHKMDPSNFITSFVHNVIPTIKITQKCIEQFRKQKSGRIITLLTSYLINKPPVGLSEYVANKAYLESLSKSWSNENVSFNISSNTISPSMTKTNLTSHIDERVIEIMEQNSLGKRLIQVEEIAQAAHFLATCTPFINGHNLVLNGGADVI